MIDYNALNDLNKAAPQDPNAGLMPAGTCIKTRISIRSGDYGLNGLFTKSQSSDSVYLNSCFIVVDGPYQNRNVFHKFGIQGIKIDEAGQDLWRQRGLSMLRGVVESALNILPNDQSEATQKKRTLPDLGKIDQMVCAVQVGIQVEKNRLYSNSNYIAKIITPDDPRYRSIMGVEKKSEDRVIDLSQFNWIE